MEAGGRRGGPKIQGFLRENGVFIPPSEDIESLTSRGYGTSQGGGLLLNFYEALFLLSKGVIRVLDEETGKEVSFQELLRRFQEVDENAWVRYLIYRDLRGRGYVAREGFGLGLVVEVLGGILSGTGCSCSEGFKGGNGLFLEAKYIIFGILEGRPVPLEELARALRYVQTLKKRLILAVLNRRGEVVYYSLSQLTLK